MTPHPDLAVVIGAFSYTGRYVTRRLLDQGVRVRTLTRSPDAEDPFGGRVEVAPLDFSDPDGLRRSMQGAGVFFNTYWIRYAHGRVTFDLAVENTRTLLEAAKRAGIGRIVPFSVTNASFESGLPYFKGKAQVEDMLVGLGVPYAIIRPSLVFGTSDLLLNNMAWALRRFPVFPAYGNGDYPVQPVYVEDVAAQAVEAGSQSGSSVADAAGPDTLSFEALFRLLASAVKARTLLVSTPPSAAFAHIGLLTSGEPPTGTTRLRDWLANNSGGLGQRNVSELRRNFRLQGKSQERCPSLSAPYLDGASIRPGRPPRRRSSPSGPPWTLTIGPRTSSTRPSFRPRRP